MARRRVSPTDYCEILEALPLPEKYLLGKTARGSQGSSESDDWTLDSSDCHTTEWDRSSDGVLLSEHENIHDSDSGVHSDVAARHAHWASADTGLDLLGLSTLSTAYQRSSNESLNTSGSSDTRGGLSWFGLSECSRVRSLGSTPIMDRKNGKSANSRKSLGTESVLKQVKELLRDQAARARVSGIVEAQKARAASKKNETAPAVTTSSITGQGTPVSSSTAFSSTPSALRSSSSQTTCSVFSSDKVGKSRRAVKRTDDISLFNPKFSVARDTLTTRPKDFGSSSNSPLISGAEYGGKGAGGITFSGTRSSDGVPTAHVMPHSLSQKQSQPMSGLTKYPSEENIRRNRDPELPPGERTPRSSRRASDILEFDSSVIQKHSSHAWNPQEREVLHSVVDEFHTLEPNMTLEATQYVRDTAPAEAYKLPSSGLYLHKRHTSTELLHHTESLPSRSDPAVLYNTMSSYPRDNLSSASHGTVCSSITPPTSYGHVSSSADRYAYSGSRTGGSSHSSVYNPQTYSSTETSAMPYSSGHSVPGDPFASDLTSWQQRHQEALRRQQFEAAHPMLSMAPPSYLHSAQSAASSVLLRDPHKLDAIKLAADNIIKEKDMIIDRQKSKIIDLERRTKDSDVDKHKDLLRRARDDSETLGVKLQKTLDEYLPPKEYQYENAALKVEIAEYVAAKRSSKDDADRKLGEAEYELQKLKQKVNRETVGRSEEIGLLATKIGDKDMKIKELKDHCSDVEQKKGKLQQDFNKMEGYMNNLPTMDEYNRQLADIREFKEDRIRHKQRVASMEKKTADLQKSIKSRDALIETLEGNEGKLKAQIEKIENDNKALRDRLTQSGCPVDDLENLQFENKQLKANFDKAKKLLDTKQKRQQQTEAHHKTELSSLEERLGQEESAVTALREEILSKDQNIVQLRQSVRELGGKNQDLLQNNLHQKDKIGELESQVTGDIRKVENRLMKEITVCFCELQSLVQICVQHAEGQDPNLSALLGAKGATNDDPDPYTETKGVASLKYKVEKVREMRNEIDKLRELISNKYVEDMGENLNCTTQ